MASFFAGLMLLMVCICGAVPTVGENAAVSARALDYEIIYNLPPTMSAENIILRSNGQLLVTCISCPTISQLDPTLGPTQQRRTVYTFGSGVINVLGIVELRQDVFAVATGQANVSNGEIRGPTSVWMVDLTKYQAPTYNSSLVRVQQVASPSTAGLFDGLAIINAEKGILAATDFVEGKIWRIDIPNQGTTVLVDSPILAAGPGANLSSLLLANGLKYKSGQLFFTASATGTFGYVPVNPSTGAATGNVTVIYDYGMTLDDFNFGPTGNVYLTTLSEPNGGILRRAAGTPIGQRGTTKVVSKFGTNSVIPVDNKDGSCTLLFSAILTFQIGRATIPGPC